MRSSVFYPIAALLFLVGCGEDGPSSADITSAYEAWQAEYRAELLARYGTEENVPDLGWAQASIRYEAELIECEKAQDARGYLCIYNLRLFARGGDVEMTGLSPVENVEARVFRVSDGWAFEKLGDEEG